MVRVPNASRASMRALPSFGWPHLAATTCLRPGECAVFQESIRDSCSSLLDGRRGQPRDVVEFVEIRELPTIARN